MTRSPLCKLHRVALISGLLLLSSCRSGPAAGSLDDVARQYVALAVQLGEHDVDSLDFNLSTKVASNHGPERYPILHERSLALRNQLMRMPDNSGNDSARKTLLLGQLSAIALRLEQLQGHNRSFDEESRTLFGVTAPNDQDAEARKSIRTQIAVLLGKPADVAKAYSTYEAQFIVPANRVPAVMLAALDQCRNLTLAHMVLPPGEQVDIQYVRLKPWSAYSTYLGGARSLIQVNMDYPLTVDRLLTLACHEGYPGHHVFNSMRDQALVQKAHRQEFLVQPTFSPQSYVSEAAASYAPILALSDADRLRIERDVLMPLAGLKDPDVAKDIALGKLLYRLHTAEPAIARDYIDERLEFIRAANSLEHETLMEHAEVTLLYLNEFRTYMLAYTVGCDSLQAFVESNRPAEAERWRRYVQLMTNPVVLLPKPTGSSESP